MGPEKGCCSHGEQILLEQNPCSGQQVSQPGNPLLRVLCPIHRVRGTGHSMELPGPARRGGLRQAAPSKAEASRTGADQDSAHRLRKGRGCSDINRKTEISVLHCGAQDSLSPQRGMPGTQGKAEHHRRGSRTQSSLWHRKAGRTPQGSKKAKLQQLQCFQRSLQSILTASLELHLNRRGHSCPRAV